MRTMERFLVGGEFTEIKRIEKEGSLLRVSFEGVDSEGDCLLYEYYALSNGEVRPVIDVVFHDKKGTPCGGHNVANYEQGTWKIQD